MASGYMILDSFNRQSTKGMNRTSRARFRTKDILVSDIYSNDKNFYEQEGIEEKAGEILAVGLLSNLVVADIPSEDGIPYRLVSGERRWRALKLLVERGHEEFKTVTCQIRTPSNEHEEMIELIIANSAREKDVATLIREEQTLKEELQYMKDNKLELNGYDLQSGKLRDIVASILNVSKTKIAEIEAVSKRLLPDFKKELDRNRLTFSAAYQLSKLKQEEQGKLYQRYQEEGELSYKDVVDYAKEKEKKLADEQLPGQMTFNKTGMVTDEVKNIAEPEQKEVTHVKKCITGENPYGVCVVCCGFGGVECCSQCSKDCNARCGWHEKKEEAEINGVPEQDVRKEVEGQKKNDQNVMNETEQEHKSIPEQEVPKVETAEKNVTDTDTKLMVLKNLIEKELQYVRLAHMDSSVSKINKLQYQVALDAFRFYKKYLEEGKADE